MKKRVLVFCGAAAALGLAPLRAQTHSSQIPHTPEELDKIWLKFGHFPGQARDGKEFTSYRMPVKTLAQALIEQLPKLYPEVQYGVMHAKLPDGKDSACIASWELTEIGEKDNTSGDLIVSQDGQLVINPRKAEDYSRTVVRVKMLDASGHEIPAVWAIYFKSTSANDWERYSSALRSCMKINEEMSKKIPSLAALFEPATKYGYDGKFNYEDYKNWLK